VNGLKLHGERKLSQQKPQIISTMNEAAVELFDEMLEMEQLLKGKMIETSLGPTILDVGLEASGGFLAGEYTIQVCMGGLAEVSVTSVSYSSDFSLPAVWVSTDHPVVATMGSQLAGWPIKKGDYRALGSGPARILANKPKKIYEQLPIQDLYTETVLVLETNVYPPENVMDYIAQKCKVALDSLCLLVVPSTSITGAMQIAGRSVETAIHKLFDLGMDILSIKSASGICPIAPVAKNDEDLMMGRTNDMLIYGAEVFLQVDYPDDKELAHYLAQAVSSASKEYGKPFLTIFKNAGGDFYKIDSSLFAPAKLIVNNLSTGKLFTYGAINLEMLKKMLDNNQFLQF